MIERDPDDPVVRATLAFAEAMRPPETGTLAEWEAQQHAAYEALMQAVEEYLMKKEAERATDS